ncbi:MAG: permease prefix domain 1-containing protein [Deltaproteobacteria bacterium]
MPEEDFELYLSLLSRFLRLKSAQRDEIADELRDHLEARLEELAAQGMSREEAIRAALDEFGDAAELASHFTRAAHIRKRRLIMRLTFGSVAALAASLLVATAFWPESPQAPAPRNAVAQGLGDVPKRIPAGKSVATEDEDKTAVEKKLAKQLGKIEFASMPLGEVLEYIGDQIDIDILVVPEGDAGAAEQDSFVNLRVKRAKLSARTALDLVLEPLGLGYTIRDGLILVTSSAQASQIQVYNVRDLLRDVPLGGITTGVIGGTGGGMLAAWGTGDGMGMMQVADDGAEPGEPDETQLAQGFGGAGGGAAPPDMPRAGVKRMNRGMGGMGMGGEMPGGGGGGAGRWAGIGQTHSLAQVIATTIDPESWDSNGGNGSVVQYHELLVVKNSQAVHGKIKALLEMMRASAREIPAEGEGGRWQPEAPGAGAGGPAGPAPRPGTSAYGVAPPGAVDPASPSPDPLAPPNKK